MLGALIGGGIQLGSALFGALSRRKVAKKQMEMANKINPNRVMYQTSKTALENKALAQNAANAMMPGAITAQQGILANQQNVIGAAQRNATSSADALSVAAATNTATNDAYVDLADQQARFGLSAQDRVMGANDALTDEARYIHQDQLDFYKDQMAQKNALIHASMANRAGAGQDFATMGMIAGDTAKQIDWKKLFS